MLYGIRLALCLILLYPAMNAHSAESSIDVGDIPPDFLGKNSNGDKVLISDHRGKVVVVSFFATWCPQCRKEIPMLARIQEVAGPDKLTVIAIDYEEDRAIVSRVRKMFKDYGLTFTHDTSGKIGKSFGVNGIPHMVIVGADGKVAAKHVGYGENSLQAIIDDINRIYRESHSAVGSTTTSK